MSGAVAVAIGHGDSTFWQQVYQVHGPAVLAFLRSRSRSVEDAEELFQETFLRAMGASRELRDRSRVRSFLFTTAANLLRNQARRQRVSPLEADGELPDTAAAATADGRALASGILEQLEQALLAMPEGHRRAFVLGVLERLPYRLIAERTGWSLATVKINVYRARKRVASELAGFLPERGEER